MKLNLKDIAFIICRAEGRDGVAQVHNQLRTLTAKRLLTTLGSYDLYGPKGALLYRPEAIFRARLLLSARGAMLHGPDIVILNDALSPSALNLIIRGTQVGEDWIIRVFFSRDRKGRRCIKPITCRLSEPITFTIPANETHLGTAVIPASDLIRSLLDQVDYSPSL